MSRPEDLPYRPCVGMMVLNRDGLVFIGRRSGGPEHLDAAHAWGGRYRGQTQKWYALRFTGDESEIDVVNPAGGHEPEFAEWRWEPMRNLAEIVIGFKRKVYEQVVAEFAHLVR